MNQQQRASQATSLVEAAGNAAGKLLVSAKYRLEDLERFYCFPETVLVLDRQWHIYFYTLMRGYQPEPQSSQLLKYTFAICTPVDKDYKASIVAASQKKNTEPTADGLDVYTEYMMTFLPIHPHTLKLVQFLQEAMSEFWTGRGYRFEFLSPVVVTKQLDFAFAFYEDNSLRDMLVPPSKSWVSKLFGRK